MAHTVISSCLRSRGIEFLQIYADIPNPTLKIHFVTTKATISRTSALDLFLARFLFIHETDKHYLPPSPKNSMSVLFLGIWQCFIAKYP
jgi:hypothetical protein